MAKMNKNSNSSYGKLYAHSMIKDDPSAPDYCPRSPMEKVYPRFENGDMSYGKDLYEGAQATLAENHAQMKKEMKNGGQYY